MSGEAQTATLRCDRCDDVRPLNGPVELGMVHHCRIGGLGAYRLHREAPMTKPTEDSLAEGVFDDAENDGNGWADCSAAYVLPFARMFKRQRDEARAEVSRLTAELDRVQKDYERFQRSTAKELRDRDAALVGYQAELDRVRGALRTAGEMIDRELGEWRQGKGGCDLTFWDATLETIKNAFGVTPDATTRREG